MESFDVIIIGAGPAGLYAAGLCEKNGLKPVIIEEHKEIGLPVQCSGLISTNLANLVEIDNSWVEHKVKGALLHSGNETFVLEKKSTAAYVIDRRRFDSWLSEQVKSTIVLGERASSFYIRKNRVEVKTGKFLFKGNVLFGCDGPNSMVRNFFGERPEETVTGIIAIEEKENHSPYVEMWYDKNLVPDGFVWKIPRGNATEYGMLSSKPRFRILEKLFGIRKYRKLAGAIPFGFHKTYFDRTLLIGDSASQVKPWSGGGVVYSLTASKIAVDVTLRAFSENNFSEQFLSEYEKQWHNEFGINIAIGMMFRDVYRSIGNNKIREMFRLMRNTRNINSLDMDFPHLNLAELF